MNALWTDSVTRVKGPAPGLTSVKISNSLTVPREAIKVTAYYLNTMLGHSPPTCPRWKLLGILQSINYIFPGYADLKMEDLEVVLGFMHQPGEVEKVLTVAASVVEKVVSRLEPMHFNGTHSNQYK